MDELEISGKRYISSRRAAKEHKYHVDYIGQLIRAHKVSGTKVGRAWYVDEASLNEYFGKEIQVAPPKKELSKEVPVFAVEVPVAQALLSTEVATLQNESKEPRDTTGASLESEEIPITIHRAAHTNERTALTYIADDEPLYPYIPSRVESRTEVAVYEEPQQHEFPVRHTKNAAPHLVVSPSGTHKKSRYKAISVFTFFGISLVMFLLMSAMLYLVEAHISVRGDTINTSFF